MPNVVFVEFDDCDVVAPSSSPGIISHIYRSGEGYQFFTKLANSNEVYCSSNSFTDLQQKLLYYKLVIESWLEASFPSDPDKQMFIESDTEEITSIAISTVGNITESGNGYQYSVKLINANVYQISKKTLNEITTHRNNVLQVIQEWSDRPFQSL